MKALFWFVAFLLAACPVCRPAAETPAPYTAEQMTADMCAGMDRMIEAVGSVKDEPSATAAVAQLKVIDADFLKLAERAKGVATPDAPTQASLMAKLNGKSKEVQERMRALQPQLQGAGPAAGLILLDGLKEFSASMMQVATAFQKLAQQRNAAGK